MNHHTVFWSVYLSVIVCTHKETEMVSKNGNPQATDEKATLKRRISSLVNGGDGRNTACGIDEGAGARIHYDGMNGVQNMPATEEHVYLYPTGMSSMWHAHQMCLKFAPGMYCACFGSELHHI